MSDSIIAHIRKPGLHTSIQDDGRWGVQDQGIPVSGAMDKQAMQMANDLVGNPPSQPVLEMTMIGPTILFENACQIAITGAKMSPSINGNSVDSYCTIDIEAGDLLEFDHASEGCRTYLSIGGKWNTPKWLGSFSAVPNTLIHDQLPAQLQSGHTLEIESQGRSTLKITPDSKKPVFSSVYVVRVLTGPEFGLFNMQVIEAFFETIFTIDLDANRMGYRLMENLVDYKPVREELSSGVVNGTIQVTNAGKPIILMADAQTTGGYPRIANVLTEDLDVLAQMKPGDQLKFMLVSF
ncbi:biotin-dependent carboxyltransferase family protein [Roseivirga sp.]|uniref:5-oxoprolinase subunit C family protein n=1 Tax=Roseivirga sp. TaxID=1964215 RepID=UPI003B8B22D4